MPDLLVPPLPLLITGVAGVAGYNALSHFRRRFPRQVIAIRRTDNWPLKGEGILACDGDDKDQMRRLFDRHQFRSVLNCEGTCKLKSCELDPAMAQRVNIDSVVNLLEVVGGAEVRLVHLSIDLVYSGTRGGQHVEDDPTDPVTVYGKTMAEAEQIILRKRPDACQLRISLPMGVSFNGHAGAIDWIQSRFKKQKPATLYYDEIRTPTYTDCLNPLLQRVLAGNLSGLFHAGGPRALSLYQIAQVINRVGGYDPDHLMGCNRIEAGPIPPRAGDVSMDSGKLARALGHNPFDPWPHDDALVPTHRDWHRERPPGEQGSAEYLREVLYHNPRRKRARELTG
ncbi:MAG: SDR family oxidoreductase [Pirellulaceae bacterium]